MLPSILVFNRVRFCQLAPTDIGRYDAAFGLPPSIEPVAVGARQSLSRQLAGVAPECGRYFRHAASVDEDLFASGFLGRQVARENTRGASYGYSANDDC